MTRDAGARALQRAAAPLHDGRALALHRPARLRPRVRTRSTAPRPRSVADSMLDIDAAGIADATEGGIEIERAPRASPSSRCRRPRAPRDAGRPGGEVRPPTTPPSGSTGCSCTSRRASSSRSRSTCASATRRRSGSLFWRLLVVAEEGSRFTLIEESASTDPELESYTNAVVEVFVEQARSSSTSPSRTSRARPGTSPRTTRGSARGRRARLGRRRLRLAEGQDHDPEQARRAGRDLARDRRLLRRRRPAPRLRHAPGAQAPNTTSDFAFKGALRDQATSVWRGMIRVEPDAQKTNAYQENRNLLLSPEAHADSIPGLEILANDVRCTHGATIGQVEPRRALLLHGARALARGGGAPDRPRLLPGDPRPHRARTGARRAPERARGAAPPA